MLNLKLLSIITASVLLIACQVVSDKPLEQTDDDTVTVAAKKKSRQEAPTHIDTDVLYLLLTGETALQRKQYDIALEAYLEAAKRVKDPRVAQKAAQIAAYLEKSAKTESAASVWLDKDEKNATARQLALSGALKNKDQAAMVKHFEAILKNDPASFEATVLRLEKNLKTDADKNFLSQSIETLSKQHPKQAGIFLVQAFLAARQNNLDLAFHKTRQTLALQPNWEKALNFEAELMMFSGKLAFKNKQYAQALSWFDKVKRPNLEFDAALAGIAVLTEQKQFPAAQKRLDHLLKKNYAPKQYQELLLLQAELYSLQKNYQPAFDILTAALKDNPDSRDLLYTRALTAEKMNNMAVLETDLQKILAQDPDDVGALNALGYSLTDKTNRYDEAESYLQRAIKLQPDDAMIIDSYGWLKYKQGQLEQALQYLQKAYQKMPENEITAHLVEVLWQSGKKSEAQTLLNEALKKTPEDEFLQSVKQRFFRE